MIQSVSGQQSQSFRNGISFAELHLKAGRKFFQCLSKANAAFNKGGVFNQDKYHDFLAGYTARMAEAGVTPEDRPTVPVLLTA